MKSRGNFGLLWFWHKRHTEYFKIGKTSTRKKSIVWDLFGRSEAGCTEGLLFRTKYFLSTQATFGHCGFLLKNVSCFFFWCVFLHSEKAANCDLRGRMESHNYGKTCSCSSRYVKKAKTSTFLELSGLRRKEASRWFLKCIASL